MEEPGTFSFIVEANIREESGFVGIDDIELLDSPCEDISVFIIYSLQYIIRSVFPFHSGFFVTRKMNVKDRKLEFQHLNEKLFWVALHLN